jgi:hypothetical protein
LGPAAQMSALPAWLPDQLKIDNQRKCRQFGCWALTRVRCSRCVRRTCPRRTSSLRAICCPGWSSSSIRFRSWVTVTSFKFCDPLISISQDPLQLLPPASREASVAPATSFNIFYHSLFYYSRPRDDRKKNTHAIEFCELGDVYQIVEHRLCRPTEDEAVAVMDRRTAPSRNPGLHSHL